MRDYTNWNGQVVKKLILNGELPEYSNYLIYPDGSYVPHDSPYHKETIFDHVIRVVDEAAKLSKRFKLSEEEHIILMVASTWHDTGKVFSRKEKTRQICDKCGKPYSMSFFGTCKTAGCISKSYTPRVVMGYENYEKIGAEGWLFGNIAIREGFPAQISMQVKTLIRNHLDVLQAVQKDLDYSFTKLNLLLSWADEKGRDKPGFDNISYTDRFNRIYRELEE